MTKRIERNVAEIIMIVMITMVLLSSCGSNSYCMQSEWANPLSKQYSNNR